MNAALQRGLRSTFSSLSVRNYRLFFIGQVVSVSGTFMQMVAQAWLVLDLTGSPTALGGVTAVQFLPMLFLAPYAGLLADRVDKRRILLATQVVAGLLAVALGVLTATDVVRMWMVFVLAALLGLVTAFDSPARQTFITEMVGAEKLPNALGLNTITMNSGRLVGPAIAGLVIGRWDMSVCFLVNGLSYIAPVTVLMLMRRDELFPAQRVPRAPRQFREGLRHAWSQPGLRLPLLLMLAVGTFTFEFTVTLPVLARTTFGADADGHGLMQTMMSVGAIVGGLAYATRTTPNLRRLSGASVAFGAVVLALAVSPTFAIALVVLPLVGAGTAVFIAFVNAILQLNSAPEMRSRVMALYGVAFLGSTPVGGPAIGRLSETFGVRWGLAVGGLTALVGGILTFRARRAILTSSDAPFCVMPPRPAMDARA